MQRGWSGGVMQGNILYLGSRDGRLIAVDVGNNSRTWIVPLETGTTSVGLGCSRVPVVAYIYGSPIITDNLVYVGGYNGKVYSFVSGEKSPDRTLDRVRIGDRDLLIGPIEGSLTHNNGIIYFGCGAGRVYAINERLQPVWDEPFQTGGKIVSTPVVANGVVYIGSYDNKLYALDAASGRLIWEYATEGVLIANPVIDGDTVYIASFDKKIYAINITEGELRWSFAGGHGFWATPIVREGQLYAPCLNGKVYVLKASDGKLVTEVDIGSPISATPVIVGENLVVVTEESKASGNLKKGSAVWTIMLTTNRSREIARLEGEKVSAPLVGNEKSVFVHTYRDSLFGIDIDNGAVRQFSIK